MFLSLKTLYRKRTVIWPFYFYTIIRTLSTLKSLCLSIVLYIYLGGGSFFTIYMLLTIEVQNIILFITLFVIFLFFLFLNMCSLYDNKVHVLFKSNGIEKF
ncbi:DUF443 family protein [Staphylococcus aureus]|uniref:DUF443 family protein n=4 Tax=Staphylococcus aureus TaxID=1280 RepID=A0ABD6JIZ0_STAAU|nr:DUF443 family protein [Staphylococcus aureus]AUU63961.1 DUF443 domain-containing protein [Staphylococcus aureus]AWI94907.1 DUF443 domain-containing protein [Staphylococcus aureus]NDP56544.1 DUF443 family protein [Staphylococcus aureus]NDP77650.1 DUF443 family protein [Staphylococcus aureus]NDP88938.1 DUF443 family protein [Staphylococcus aureus]